MRKNILLKGAHIIDPSVNLDEEKDILVSEGIIQEVEENIKKQAGYEVMDVSGKIITPALFDMHTHLRTPGREDEETLLSGGQAALKGGFTRICCMPNTEPAIDNSGLVKFIIEENKKSDGINIYPIGAVTKGRKGKKLTEMYDMKEAGAVAFSDDGNPVEDSDMMMRALEYAGMLNVPIISHCEDFSLAMEGHMNEGYVSTVLGIKGIPNEAESFMVARDIGLSRMTNSTDSLQLICPICTCESVRQEKKEGIKVSCETCPQYFSLTEEKVLEFDANAKVNPPLRTKEDVKAIIKGLIDGTIDVIASDHAPHAVQEKELEFDKAPFGMIGLETSLALGISKLIKKRKINWTRLIELMSINPAKVVNKKVWKIKKGEQANFIVIEKEKWVFNKENVCSLSSNSPFMGEELEGVVCCVFSKGQLLDSKK